MHTRRPRYPGKNPRGFHDKYKELNPERYASDVREGPRVRQDAGGHASADHGGGSAALPSARRPATSPWTARSAAAATREAILERVQPGGRLIGLDVDPLELPRTEARLRAAGFGPETFVARHGNFAGLPQVLAAEGLAAADLILADLGVSSMQIDNPDRGFSYKEPGPLDMRMNPVARRAGVAAARAPERRRSSRRCSTENADEPHAAAHRRSAEAASRSTRRTPSSAWCAPGSPRRCRSWRRPT